MKTMKALASKLLKLKETKTRDTGESFITFNYEKEPSYKFQSIVMESHLGELPNDFAYASIADALTRITESEYDSILEMRDDGELYYDDCPSNREMLGWLSDNLSRQEYIEEYRELNPDAEFWSLLLGGMAVHYEKIVGALITELQKECERVNK